MIDFLGYIIGAGQLALLLGIFQRLGTVTAELRGHEQRIEKLETEHEELRRRAA